MKRQRFSASGPLCQLCTGHAGKVKRSETTPIMEAVANVNGANERLCGQRAGHPNLTAKKLGFYAQTLQTDAAANPLPLPRFQARRGKRDSLKESALFPFFTGITACALWLCAQYMQREGGREREIEGDLREGPICRMSGRNQKTISQSRCLKFFSRMSRLESVLEPGRPKTSGAQPTCSPCA